MEISKQDDESQVKQARIDLTELGTTGLNQFGGWISEEVLKQLEGQRGMRVFREMEDNDSTVGAIMFVIDKLIRAVEWKVTPFSKSPEDIQRADFLDSNRKDMEQPWTEVISEIMSMTTFGQAPLEMVFKIRRGQMGLQLDTDIDDRIPSSRFNDGLIGWAKLPLRAQETIQQWKISPKGAIEGFWQIAPPSFNRVFIPIDKVLLFRTSMRKNNPLGRSILRNAFRPWFFKKKIENIEGIGVERDLAGLPFAGVPPEILSKDASDEEKAILATIKQIVTNVRRDEQEGVIFPLIYDENNNPLYEFKLLSTGGGRQFKTNEIINRYRQDIAFSVIADFILLGHEKTGSFALADSKTKIFSLALKAWLQVIADIFNRKAIPTLFMLNGMDTENLPELTFGDIETVDLQQLAVYITALTGAGIDLTGDNIANYLKGQANFPREETDGV